LAAGFPHIRYLCFVREVFRHRRIGLAQPAATQAVAKIEAQLGVALFDRKPKGMYPTDVGQIFERRVIRVLAHLRRGGASHGAKHLFANARRSSFGH